jgi:two-component system KDP operon response regulator KdpE
MNNTEILVIDDETQIRRLLEITLQSNDYKVTSAPSARLGLAMAASHPPEIILLDLGLPDEDGHIVIQKLREWYSKPIIILSVQSSEEAIVKALDYGANDYLIKPFRSGELLARIRSVLRGVTTANESPIHIYSDLMIDLSNRVVAKNNVIIKLTTTEYALLTILAKNVGKVLTHKYLLKEVWGPAYTEQSQYLRVFIAQLRKKIENDPNKPIHILTESGVGYRFIE